MRNCAEARLPSQFSQHADQAPFGNSDTAAPDQLATALGWGRDKIFLLKETWSF
jgi:hypothetical protein